MSKRFLTLLSTATLLALPAAANPATSYVEAAAGLSRGDIDCSGTTQCDRSSSFGRLSLGHSFMPGLAAEVSIGQWGTLKAAADVPGFGNATLRVQARGVGIGIAAAMPLAADWTLAARLGVASNQARVTGTALGVTSRSSERHTAPYAGVGIRYAIGDGISIGLHVDSTRVKAEGEKATLTMAGAALRFDF